ncbi:hypothetical protein L218DRAFT_336303 [Marasmius fiardii PR-910]|nr:hypothetical protein L218DRAFT_336303 [Marasmius fiardii PR-910]
MHEAIFSHRGAVTAYYQTRSHDILLRIHPLQASMAFKITLPLKASFINEHLLHTGCQKKAVKRLYHDLHVPESPTRRQTLSEIQQNGPYGLVTDERTFAMDSPFFTSQKYVRGAMFSVSNVHKYEIKLDVAIDGMTTVTVIRISPMYTEGVDLRRYMIVVVPNEAEDTQVVEEDRSSWNPSLSLSLAITATSSDDNDNPEDDLSLEDEKIDMYMKGADPPILTLSTFEATTEIITNKAVLPIIQTLSTNLRGISAPINDGSDELHGQRAYGLGEGDRNEREGEGLRKASRTSAAFAPNHQPFEQRSSVPSLHLTGSGKKGIESSVVPALDLPTLEALTEMITNKAIVPVVQALSSNSPAFCKRD